MIAAYAVAITHDTCNHSRHTNQRIWMLMYSQRINVTCASIIVKLISTASLFFIYCIPLAKTNQQILHNIIQPSTIQINVKIHIQILPDDSTALFCIKLNTIKNIATAVQSLKRLSHSNMSWSLLGIQISLKIANTATGSVDEIITPNKNRTIYGISIPTRQSMKNKGTLISTDERISQKVASVQIGNEFLIK